MNQRFDNQTVIVTGGGGGIGGATCRRFGSEGAAVAVFDLNLEAAEKVAAAIRAEGGARAGLPLRHHRPRQRRRRGRRGRVDARPDRRAGQQRRLGRLQAVHEDRAGAVGQADRDQPDGRAAHAPRRAAGHGGAQEGPHRQHRVRRGARRLVRRGGLRGVQGWPGRRSPRPSRASMRATASPSTSSAPGRPTPRCSPTTRKAPATPRS